MRHSSSDPPYVRPFGPTLSPFLTGEPSIPRSSNNLLLLLLLLLFPSLATPVAAVPFPSLLAKNPISPSTRSLATTTWDAVDMYTAYSSPSTSDGDTVSLRAGTFSGTSPSDSTFALCILPSKAVSFVCSDLSAPDKCILSGLDARRVVSIANDAASSSSSTAVSFEGFTVTRGTANWATSTGLYDVGGGMKVTGGARVLVTTCAFSSNVAKPYSTTGAGGSGGAIYAHSSSLLVTACSFLSNSASNGGAVYLYFSSATIIMSTFTSNSAQSSKTSASGGAIFVTNQSPQESPPYQIVDLYSTSFTGNSAKTFGTNIYLNFGTITAYSYCPPGFQNPNDAVIGASLAGTSANGMTAVFVGSSNSYSGCAIASCAIGTYRTASMSACTPCPVGRYNSNPSTSTTSFMQHDELADCEICPAGRYNSDAGTGAGLHDEIADCKICPAGTYNSDAATSATLHDDLLDCSICGSGRYNSDAANSAALHDDLSDCTLCPAGKYLADNANLASAHDSASDCIICSAGAYAATTGSWTCNSCPAGTYLVDAESLVDNHDALSDCTVCGVGTYSAVTAATSPSTCTACAAGTFNSDDAVAASNHDSSTDCIACAAGTYSAGGATTCTSCAAGTFYGTTGGTVCMPCAIGTYSAGAGASACSICEKGTYTDATGTATSCVVCPAGTYLADSGTVATAHDALSDCAVCPKGRYNNDFATAATAHDALADCTVCSSGRYLVDDGTAARFHDDVADCTPCGLGKSNSDAGLSPDLHSSESNCVSCSAGSYNSNLGSSACTNCDPGTPYGTSIGAASKDEAGCIPCFCAVGKYCPAKTDCVACPAGRYSATMGVTSCSTCELGRYSNSESSSCLPCDAGKKSSEGLNACENCLAGSWSGTGSSTCVLCFPGRYSEASQSTCSLCDPGKYSNMGDAVCAVCGFGTYSGMAASTCSVCAVGSYSSGGASSCTVCGAGTRVSDSKTGCTVCEVGTYSLGFANVCTPCAVGKTSTSDFTGCQACSPGKFLRDNSCSPCEAGKYAESGWSACVDCESGYAPAGASYCTSCGAGFQTNAEKTDCNKCEVGKFSLGSVSTCTSCPSGKVSTLDFATCLACSPGEILKESVCEACQVGKFAKSGWALCLDCESGKFSSGDDRSYCVACEQYQSADPADKTKCKCKTGFVDDPTKEVLSCTCEPGQMLIGESCEVCEKGRYKDWYGIQNCEICDRLLERSTTLGKGAKDPADCRCPEGTYFADNACTPAARGMCEPETCKNSTLFGRTLEDTSLLPGFWRISKSTADVRPCPVAHACVGGSDPDTYCRAGHHGPYCHLCESGFTSDVFGLCQKCQTSSHDVINTLLLVAGIAVFIWAWFFLVKKYKTNKKRKHAMAVIKGGLKILFVTFQILATLPSIIPNLTLPENFKAMLNSIQFMKLNFFQIINVGCFTSGFNFYTMLLCVTLFPLSLIGALVMVGLKWSGDSRAKCFTVALAISYVVLPSVTTVIFGAFPCDAFEYEGKTERFLIADYSISCEGRQYQLFKLYAGLMVFLLPVGVPFTYFIVLWRRRRILQLSVEEREQNDEAVSVAFLYDLYKPQFWWFEVFETGRRLALTGALGAVKPGTISQLALGMLVSLVAVGVFCLALPYIEMRENALQILANFQIFVVMLTALVMKYRNSSEDDGMEDQYNLGVVLIFLNVCGAASFVAFLLLRFVAPQKKELLHSSSLLNAFKGARNLGGGKKGVTLRTETGEEAGLGGLGHGDGRCRDGGGKIEFREIHRPPPPFAEDSEVVGSDNPMRAQR